MIRPLLRALLPRRFRFTTRLAREVRRRGGGRVAGGPFSGASCPPDSVGSEHLPKLLGTYELELHAVVAEICESAPGTVIVVGAAEGYYAVGFALRLPEAAVIAYEADPRGRELLAASWRDNALAPDRLDLRGICAAGSLARDLHERPGAVVVMDVEGAEAVLADPEVVPGLAVATLLVEVHEFALPGVGELLRERFAESHRIESIAARARVPTDFPAGLLPRGLPRHLAGAAAALMDERRPPGMSWLMLRPGAPVRIP